MTTDLTRPVRRRVRDRSKHRRITVTLHPGGEGGSYVGLRLEKNRQKETIPVFALWERAVRMRVAKQKAEKLARRNRER